MTTPQEFEALCRKHDLTYAFSSDSRAYSRGRAEADVIEKARRELGDEVCAPIWNKVVRERLLPPHNEMWLWPEPGEKT